MFRTYTVSLPELQQFHGVRRFELERSCCFGALLLDEERGRLFVGAKNFLLSLSLDNIAKQEHKVWSDPVKTCRRLKAFPEINPLNTNYNQMNEINATSESTQASYKKKGKQKLLLQIDIEMDKKNEIEQ